MNAKTVDFLNLMGIFFIIIFIYVLFVGDSHAPRAVGVRMTYVLRTFIVLSMYMLIATCSQRTYYAKEKWNLLTSFVQFKHCTVILRVHWVKRNYNVRFFISQGYCGDCCACPKPACGFTGSVRPSKILRCTCVSRKIFV